MKPLLVHPYSKDRPKDKAETWALLEQARREFNVVDVEVGRESYPDTIARFWGREDLIVLEDDKVPTMQDLRELSACPRTHCLFPFPARAWFRTSVEDWTGQYFPFGFGLVKFTKQVQLAVPPEAWDRTHPNDNIDYMIEMPVIQRFGNIHVHERLIKHNHARYKSAAIDLAMGHGWPLKVATKYIAPMMSRANMFPVNLSYLDQCRESYGPLDAVDKTVVVLGTDWGNSAVYWRMRGAKKIVGFEINKDYFKLLSRLKRSRVPLDFRGPWTGVEYPDGDVLTVDIEGDEKMFDLSKLRQYPQWAFALHQYGEVNTFWMAQFLRGMGGRLYHQQQGEQVWLKTA